VAPGSDGRSWSFEHRRDLVVRRFKHIVDRNVGVIAVRILIIVAELGLMLNRAISRATVRTAEDVNGATVPCGAQNRIIDVTLIHAPWKVTTRPPAALVLLTTIGPLGESE
jgi:hypothetical protein